MLADGISLPILGIGGLVVYGPLTLLVSLIESWIFRLRLAVGVRQVFKRVLWANVLSTMAGAVILVLQDAIVWAAHIQGSIPDFVAGYRWVALVLIGLYFVKTLLVEGLVLTQRSFAERIGRRRSSVLGTVILANIASYALVGPLFYYLTRPAFGGFETRRDTAWTANADVPVYFIDRHNRHIKVMSASGGDATTLVPYPAMDFLVSADVTAFAFRGTDGYLYAYRRGDTSPTLVWEAPRGFFYMQGVSLSPDHRYLAYAQRTGPDEWNSPCILVVFSLDECTQQVISDQPFHPSWCPVVAWSADGTLLCSDMERDTVGVFDATSGKLVEMRSRESMAPVELVENYARFGAQCGVMSGVGPYVDVHTDRQGDYEADTYRFFGARLRVTKHGKQIAWIANQYGLLDFGMPAPESPTFLPREHEILLEWWDQLYLIDLDHRRMGLLADGTNYVVPLPRCRVRFD